MFSFFIKPQQGETIILKVDGMHCTSCSLNIDGELEDTSGVINASTNYAQSKTTIQYHPEQVSEKKLRAVIEKLGYQVSD